MTTATRYHDISCGHRVAGHEGKCKHLHGHNYRIHFTVGADEKDNVGRVMDFSIIKEKLCMWLENNWDHKMLIWEHDPMLPDLLKISSESIVVTPFNPTAENMAEFLVLEVGVNELAKTGCYITSCTVEETRKCSASFAVTTVIQSVQWGN